MSGSEKSVIQRLHDSEIHGSVSWVYDSAFTVQLGIPVEAEGFVESFKEAEDWLRREAVRLYPESHFAREEAATLPER